MFRKRVRGQSAVASLATFWPVNVALPIIKVQVDGIQCSALVNTGCSWSIVSADQCNVWSSQQVDMRTIDRTSYACCGVRTVSILTNGGGHAIVNVLVASERPLGYDLLHASFPPQIFTSPARVIVTPPSARITSIPISRSKFFFFHHTTCGSTCDTLASSAAIQGDNTVSVA